MIIKFKKNGLSEKVINSSIFNSQKDLDDFNAANTSEMVDFTGFHYLEGEQSGYEVYKLISGVPALITQKEYEEFESIEVEIEKKKISKLAELDVAFETSKKIIVKNGVTIEIKNREIFLSKIKIVGRVDANPETVYCYYQNEDGVGYSIAAHPIVLQKIYNKYFKHTRQTGTQEFVSDHNKVLETRYKSKINNATTLEQLDFDLEFENPTGITIEINETANEMLADSGVPEFIKDFINKLKDEEGNIHLIQVLND